jgi:hypothetical protein
VVVLIVIVAIVILVVVLLTAVGHGGGLSIERNDYAPLDLGPVSATDVALLRPPTGVWGYNMQLTDEAMARIAESIRERDVRIVALEQLVTDLSRDHAPLTPLASPYERARHRRGALESGALEPGILAAGTVQAGTVQAGTVQAGLIQPAAIERGAIEYANPGPGRPSFDYAGPEYVRPSVDHPGPDAITKPDPKHPAFQETSIDEIQVQSGDVGAESVRLPKDGDQAPEHSHD